MNFKLLSSIAAVLAMTGCQQGQPGGGSKRIDIVMRSPVAAGARDTLIQWANANPDTLIVQTIVPECCRENPTSPGCPRPEYVRLADTVRKP